MEMENMVNQKFPWLCVAWAEPQNVLIDAMGGRQTSGKIHSAVGPGMVRYWEWAEETSRQLMGSHCFEHRPYRRSQSLWCQCPWWATRNVSGEGTRYDSSQGGKHNGRCGSTGDLKTSSTNKRLGGPVTWIWLILPLPSPAHCQ